MNNTNETGDEQATKALKNANEMANRKKTREATSSNNREFQSHCFALN